MNNNMIEKDEREKRIDSIRMALAGTVGILSMTIAIIYKINDSYHKFALNMDILFFDLVLSSTVFYYIKLRIKENKQTEFTNKNFNLKFDEREKHLLIQALSFSTVPIFFLTIISIVSKLMIFNFISFARIDIGILLLMSLVMITYSFIAKDYMIPKMSKLKNSNTKRKLTDKESRVVVYISKSIRFSIIFTLFEKFYLKSNLIPYTNQEAVIWPFLINVALSFIVYFLIQYLWSEFNIRKSERFLDDLENEE